MISVRLKVRPSSRCADVQHMPPISHGAAGTTASFGPARADISRGERRCSPRLTAGHAAAISVQHVEGIDGLQPSISVRDRTSWPASSPAAAASACQPTSTAASTSLPAGSPAHSLIGIGDQDSRLAARNSTPSHLTVGGRRRMTPNHHSRRSARRQLGTAQSAGGGSSLGGSARCPRLVAPSEYADGGGPSTHPAGGMNIPRVLSVIVEGSASPAGSSATQPAEGQQWQAPGTITQQATHLRRGQGPQSRQCARELIAAERAAGARLGAPAAPDADRGGHPRPGHHRSAGRGQAELG